MKRHLLLGYGVVAYVVFVATMAYCVCFFGNLLVPRTIDSLPLAAIGEALAVNVLLVLLFGLQHSGMARQPFKNWLGRHLDPALERSTFVLVSCIAIHLMLTLWQPMGGIVWAIEDPLSTGVVYTLYFAGWAVMVASTFLINHFEMFGLSQAWAAFRGRVAKKPEFRTPGFYRHVRHPIYVGWLLVFWSAPVMTVTRLVCAACMTIYILVGIQYEERDLAKELPDYEQYKRKVPMLLPSIHRRLRRDSVDQGTSIDAKKSGLPGHAGTR